MESNEGLAYAAIVGSVFCVAGIQVFHILSALSSLATSSASPQNNGHWNLSMSVASLSSVDIACSAIVVFTVVVFLCGMLWHPSDR